MKKILISILSVLLLVSCSWKDNNKLDNADLTWSTLDNINLTWNTLDNTKESGKIWTIDKKTQKYIGPDWVPGAKSNKWTDVWEFYKLLNSKEYSKLERELKKAKQDDKEILKIYSKLYLVQNNPKDALEKALEADKIYKWKDADMNFVIGVTYDNLWKKEDAKKYITKSLEIDPKFIQAKEYLKILNDSMSWSTATTEE